MRLAFLAFTLAVTILFGLAATSARADSEARVGADWVRITALPCNDPAVMALIQQGGGDPVEWRAASAEFGGQAFAACWRPLFSQERAQVLYSDGDGGYIPFGALKPVRET